MVAAGQHNRGQQSVSPFRRAGLRSTFYRGKTDVAATEEEVALRHSAPVNFHLLLHKSVSHGCAAQQLTAAVGIDQD